MTEGVEVLVPGVIGLFPFDDAGSIFQLLFISIATGDDFDVGILEEFEEQVAGADTVATTNDADLKFVVDRLHSLDGMFLFESDKLFGIPQRQAGGSKGSDGTGQEATAGEVAGLH